MKKDCHGVNFTTSPKHPQSSTGKIVALRKVSSVKNIIEIDAKVEHIRIRNLKSSIQPIINSAPHNQIEKAIAKGFNSSNP